MLIYGHNENFIIALFGVRQCNNVSKNRFDLISTSGKHWHMPRDADALVKIKEHNYTMHDFNFNTIFNIEKYLAYLCWLSISIC